MDSGEDASADEGGTIEALIVSNDMAVDISDSDVAGSKAS